MTSIPLVQGPLRLVVDPLHGGVIRRFTLTRGAHGAVDLLRPMPEDSAAARDAACFPLFPFSNRIGFAHFSFDGRDIRLTPNLPPEPHAIHGHGWTVHWDVVAASTSACTIAYRHPAGDWPWIYRAVQEFSLTETRLDVRLTLTNLDPRPMPAGFGLHPYFPKRPGVRLTARLDHVWRCDETKLPVERVPLAEGPPPSLDVEGLDNCFGGWDGRATIACPSQAPSLGIEADGAFGHLVIYVPSGEDHFCVEPVSHANDAVHLAARGTAGTGLRTLAQNESLTGTIRFRVETAPG